MCVHSDKKCIFDENLVYFKHKHLFYSFVLANQIDQMQNLFWKNYYMKLYMTKANSCRLNSESFLEELLHVVIYDIIKIFTRVFSKRKYTVVTEHYFTL